jgi:hypothetical protein
MRTIDVEVTAAEIRDANERLPIGTRVRTASNPREGTVMWRPFACEAGTVSVLVQWDGFKPGEGRHYVRTRSLITL